MKDYGECAHCGMPMKSIGTYFEGDRFCKDCVNEGKYAGKLLTERNNHLKQAALIELQLEDMGYSEEIKPEYEHYLAQENRGELAKYKSHDQPLHPGRFRAVAAGE